MGRILAWIRGSSAKFTTQVVHGLDLIYRLPKPGVLFLVSFGGLHWMLI